MLAEIFLWARLLRRVVLPAPELPMMASISPGLTAPLERWMILWVDLMEAISRSCQMKEHPLSCSWSEKLVSSSPDLGVLVKEKGGESEEDALEWKSIVKSSGLLDSSWSDGSWLLSLVYWAIAYMCDMSVIFGPVFFFADLDLPRRKIRSCF